MTTTKYQLITLLANWIKQRPGLDFANYGDVKPYRAEMRNITRQRHDAEKLLAAVAIDDDITAGDILAAFPQAFSGRLSFDAENNRLSYCTGQYWPTEYRAAAAAVLTRVLWIAHSHSFNCGDGNAMRKHFRQQFGASLARRWFD